MAGAAPAEAQIYKGKTVTLIINYPAGGPTDIEGRIVGRYLGAHIPGKPTVIVKNMVGGGGNIAANYLGESARRDPLSVGFFTWNPVDQLMNDPGLRVKHNDFKFIAGVEQPVVIYMRRDVKPGIKQPTDLMKAEKFKAAALAPNSHGTLRMTFALDLLGVKYDLVSGYKGLKDVETAILQNEAQLSNSSLPGFRASITPTMVQPGTVIPLFHFDIQDPDGRFRASKALPDVPTFLTVYQQVHGQGKMPSGVMWDTLTLLNNILDSMFRTVLMPPGAPDEAVRDMRNAFAALAKDEEFLATYEKTIRSRPAMVLGADGEKIIQRLGAVKPEMTKFLHEYLAKISK